VGKQMKVAIFDKDLKVREIKSVNITENGDRLNIYPKGGAGNENPVFQKTSVLSFKGRHLYPPFAEYYQDWCFLRRGFPECADFKSGVVDIPGPDPDKIKQSIGKLVLDKVGETEQKTPTGLYLLLLLILGCQILIMNVLGVFK
jgi:hypothetical protein